MSKDLTRLEGYPSKSVRKKVRIRINGNHCEAEVEPRTLLVALLREKLGLKGTHIGCDEGKCGACSIILDDKLVKSCMIFSVQADGSSVITIEGLSTRANLHPIQESFWKNHALQCGYCTPGMVMAAYYLLKNNTKPTDEQIKESLAGNYCMCTGYVQIIKAIRDASTKISAESASFGGFQ